MSVAVQAGAATHVGRVREHNEDALLVTERLYAVADGMGGHAAGEVASAIAVETLAELEDRGGDVLRAADVVAAVGAANRRILEAVDRDRRRFGMGTTLTGLALVVDAEGQQQWLVLNVGDSRVYRHAQGRLEQLTTDHSEVQELVDAGLLTPHEASRHPARNIITRSLGMAPDVEPDIRSLAPTGLETYLVCSDGLTNEVDEAGLAAILDEATDPQDAADRLCQAALEAGGRDNITVVVVRSEGADPAS